MNLGCFEIKRKFIQTFKKKLIKVQFSFVFIVFIVSYNFSYSQIPTDINGLLLWLKGDSGIVLNGSTVSGWIDQSGNGYNCYQSVLTAQPIFSANELNTLPSLKFSGNEILNGPTITGINNTSTSIFVLSSGGPMSNAYNVLFNIGPFSPGGFWFSKFGESFAIYCNNASPPFLSINGDVSSSGFAPKIFELVKDFGVLSEIYLSGVYRSSSTNTEFINSFVNGSVNIGGDPTYPTGNWSGDIFEIILYNKALSDTERVAVESYLMNKYSPVVNLGADIQSCSYPVTLKAKKDYFTSYHWQDNSTADSLIIIANGTYSITTTDIFGRLSSDTISVILDTSSYFSNLGNDTTICQGQQIQISAGPSHLSYNWSTGSTLNTITTDSTGVFWVSTTDCKGLISSDTITVIVQPLPFFNLGNDTAVCYYSNFILDPDFENSSGYIFSWSDFSSDSILSIYHSDSYWLETTDWIGCKFSDTIQVAIDSSLFLTSLGPNLSLCSGNSISLTSDTTGITQYVWSDTSTNYNLVIDTSGFYSVTVTNAIGCTASDSIYINIIGKAPLPGFIVTNICYGDSTLLTDTSQTLDGSIISSWQWIIDQDTLFTQNISTVFNSADTFLIQLTVTTTNGCSNSLLKNIILHPNPLADFDITGTCKGGISYFDNQSSISGDSFSSMNWNFGDSDTSTAINPQHIYSDIGLYLVQLITRSSSGCIDSISKTIEIRPSPVASFDFSPACSGNSTYFFDTSLVIPFLNIIEWHWNFGDLNTSTQQNPQHVYNNIGIYNCGLYIKSSNGCFDTIIKPITVYAPPTANYTGDSTCVGTSFTPIDISIGNINKWKWFLNNNAVSTDTNPEIDFSNAGSYKLKLMVTSTDDCIDSVSKTITVYPLPTVSFTISHIIAPPDVVISTSNQSVSGQYFWQFGDGQTSQLYSPTHSYTDTGNYIIWLTVEDVHGCIDSISHNIKIVPEIYDLAIISVLQTENTGFMSITTNVANMGTMPIINPNLIVYTNINTPVMEVYSDTIMSGQIVSYQFTSKLPVSETETPSYICVKGNLSEGLSDNNYSNNEACKILASKSFLLNLYPNPSESYINLDLSISFSGKSQVEIFDEAGRLISHNEYELSLGFNRLIIDIRDYAKGKYNIKLIVPEGSETIEFVKY